MKTPVKSKTLWVNLVASVIAFFPGVSDKLSPEFVALGLSFINIVLRLVTKDKLGFEE